MGINVCWEDERGNKLGEEIGDPQNLLAHALPRITDADSKCLPFIDPYGDTLFNYLQRPALISELEVLQRHLSGDTERQHVGKVLDLLRREPQLRAYVRFIGD